MGFNNFKLISKRNLTGDVFKLVYEAENDFLITPGQFITFMLPKTGFARAYSVLYKKDKKVYFIIKRLETGRGGSKEICDYEVGTILKSVGPTGHFIDSKSEVPKLYLATGTGIVPLYFLVRSLLEGGFKQNLKIILGNRSVGDLYYLDKFEMFMEKYSNFDYEVYLSREESEDFKKGYVGDFLTNENISNFDEFYICGNPNMVDEVENKLKSSGVLEKNIFREKY